MFEQNGHQLETPQSSIQQQPVLPPRGRYDIHGLALHLCRLLVSELLYAHSSLYLLVQNINIADRQILTNQAPRPYEPQWPLQ